MSESFDLKMLSQRADVTPRTIHYYIQQGLLQPGAGSGRGAHYGPAHLSRLLLIRRLQRDHLPLAEIRRQIDALTEAEVEGLVDDRVEVPAPSSALDYVRRVLASEGGQPYGEARRPTLAAMGAQVGEPPPPAASVTAPGRSQWDRIALTEDIEIHIRRPLDRAQNRQVDKLLGLAREIVRGEAR